MDSRDLRHYWCALTPWWAEGKNYHVVAWHRRFDHSDVLHACDTLAEAHRVKTYLKDTSRSHDSFGIVRNA